MAGPFVIAPPLDVVLRPGSEAAEAYGSAALAPGYGPRHELDLRYFGGKTLPRLTWMNVYLGDWDPDDCTRIDHALAAALTDARLNNVLAQYFPGQKVEATFAGSRSVPHSQRAMEKDAVEKLVVELDADGSSVLVLLLPRGVTLTHGGVSSKTGLAGFHGSVHLDGGETVYYAVAVYSEGSNGIVAFREPWKNVCATVYHELQEIRTDPDVEDAIRAGSAADAERSLGWYSPHGGEVGDIEIVMEEVPLTDGSGTVPVQLMWSNAVGGPEGPISRRHPQRSAAPRTARGR